MCKENDSFYPVAFYEDHIPDHVINIFAQYFELGKFIHPAVHILAEYDAEHEYSLLETLLEYLINDRSYNLCSEKLHIHKSTLKYRLNKIRDIAGDVCFNPKARLGVLLSITMMLSGSKNKD